MSILKWISAGLLLDLSFSYSSTLPNDKELSLFNFFPLGGAETDRYMLFQRELEPNEMQSSPVFELRVADSISCDGQFTPAHYIYIYIYIMSYMNDKINRHLCFPTKAFIDLNNSRMFYFANENLFDFPLADLNVVFTLSASLFFFLWNI